MSMLMQFHFLRPHALWALLFVIPLLWCLTHFLRDGNSWKRICDPKLLPHLLIARSEKSHNGILLSIGITWVLAILALAGPTWSHLPQPVYRSAAARVIVLDLSPSMSATDLLPSRVKRATYKIIDILHRAAEGQTGMVVFSNEPYVVSPLTNDVETIASMVPVLKPSIMPSQGSNIRAGLIKAKQLMQQAGIKQGEIILLSDSHATKQDIKAASAILKEGYHISVLSIGTDQGGPIKTKDGFMKDDNGKIVIAKKNDKSLHALASSGGGSFALFTSSDSDIKVLLSRNDANVKSNTTRVENEKTLIWQDQGNWLVLLMLPFLLISFRRGWLSEVTK